MSDRDTMNGNAGQGDDNDAGQPIYNIPDSDVIPTPGNTTSVGTTTVPDADPNTPGNNPSWDPDPDTRTPDRSGVAPEP